MVVKLVSTVSHQCFYNSYNVYNDNSVILWRVFLTNFPSMNKHNMNTAAYTTIFLQAPNLLKVSAQLAS